MGERPILYSFRRCPYAMRARMALIVSGTICELREVKLSAKPPEMLALSPKGTVPVLMLPEARVIDESLDIMRWALEANDPEAWLAGDVPELIANNDGPFKYHLDRYKYPGRHGSDPHEHRAAGLAILKGYEARLSSAAQLCGDRRTLADIAIMPFVRQFAETDRGWFDGQRVPRVQAWLAWHLASPLFHCAMERVEPWVAGQAMRLFPSGAGI